MSRSKDYFNLLLINPLGKQVLAKRVPSKGLYRLSNGSSVDDYIMRDSYDFVKELDPMESARLRIGIHGDARKQVRRRPIYERNLNGFNVVVGWERV